MRTGACTALAALGLVILGCHAEATPSRQFHLGLGRIAIVPPEGWEVLDQGRTVRLRKGEAEVTIEDLGPRSPLGIGCEITRARELWREGRAKDALWCMRRIPVPDDLFTSTSQREIFWARWSDVSGASEDADPATVDRAFERLLTEVEALKPKDFPAMVDDALASEDRDGRRAVASRREITVDGHPALILDTWDRLTHTMRQRVAYVYDNGYLLALRTERGPYGATAAALDAVLEPLRIL